MDYLRLNTQKTKVPTDYIELLKDFVGDNQPLLDAMDEYLKPIEIEEEPVAPLEITGNFEIPTLDQDYDVELPLTPPKDGMPTDPKDFKDFITKSSKRVLDNNFNAYTKVYIPSSLLFYLDDRGLLQGKAFYYTREGRRVNTYFKDGLETTESTEFTEFSLDTLGRELASGVFPKENIKESLDKFHKAFVLSS